MNLARYLTLAGVLITLSAAPADAATLVADYRLDDSLESSVAGAPPLVHIGTGNAFATETVRGQPNRVVTFPKGNGLHMPNTGMFFSGSFQRTFDYTVVFDLRLASVADTAGNDYRRLLNYNDPAFGPSNNGVYVLEKKLDIYNTGDYLGDHDVFEANKYVQVAVRHKPGIDRSLDVFADGVLEESFFDEFNTWTTDGDGLRFFKDDGTEESAGAVSRIRFYSPALTQQELTALASTPDPPPPDGDGDGTFDYADNCKTASNADQADLDSDGAGDACDGDDDGDGVADGSDKCPSISNAGQEDLDADGAGDACDSDDDADGVADASDKCPAAADAAQLDADGDGQGDACDSDDDGDGVADASDVCPLSTTSGQADLDRDGIGDGCDADVDGDGVANSADICPLTIRPGANGCPGASLSKVARVRTRRAGKRGIRVLTGVNVLCAATPLPCTAKGYVARAGRTARLGRVTLTLQPATVKRITIKLTKKGAATLRRAGRLRVRIVTSVVGADGITVRLTRRVRIRAPR